MMYDSQTPAIILNNGMEFPSTPANLRALFLGYAPLLEVTVVIEDWDWGKPGVDPMITVETIGMVRYLADVAEWKLVRQRPGFRMQIPDTEAKLAPAGYWLPNLKTHDDRRQAMRHGLAYLTSTLHHLPTMRALHPRDD
jgi:hypothetical protein